MNFKESKQKLIELTKEIKETERNLKALKSEKLKLIKRTNKEIEKSGLSIKKINSTL